MVVGACAGIAHNNIVADSSDVFQVSENRDSLERARATNAGRLQSEYGRNVLPETQASIAERLQLVHYDQGQ